MNIPWSSIADKMVVIKNNNKVQYMSLFDDKVECNLSLDKSDVSMCKMIFIHVFIHSFYIYILIISLI